MQRVRWGVLGTASIARRRMIPAIQATQGGTVAAIASRDPAKAADVAKELEIPRAMGYDELITSDEIDAVYIPLPNDLHMEWSIKAARAGKHVLCEKPLGLTADEVAKVQAVAEETGRFVMEGVASHFHPVHERVAELVRDGAVGELCFIRMSLGWSFQGNRTDFRWNKAQGGGGLLDLGCYCTGTARMIVGSEPESVVAHAMFDADTDIDTNMAIMLRFGGEITALIDCGILSASRNTYEVIGTTGRIGVEMPFGNGSPSRKITVYDLRGNAESQDVLEADQLILQFENASRCILQGSPAPVALSESYANARVLDACMTSARSGGEPVKL